MIRSRKSTKQIRKSLIPGVPEGRTVSNLRFQPEAQHEAKTREGFTQSEVENGKPLQGFGSSCMFFPPVKTGGYLKETPPVF